jgi:hypothetical protein
MLIIGQKRLYQVKIIPLTVHIICDAGICHIVLKENIYGKIGAGRRLNEFSNCWDFLLSLPRLDMD